MQKKLSQLHPAIIELLKKRGFESAEELKEFFSWDLKDLPDFSSLKDIRKAAVRIVDAIRDGEPIAIYGDYDVDGTTSCALLWHFFQLVDVPVELYQPSRFVEGYGLHGSSIDQASTDGITLMITVDCGITNVDAAAYAKEKGIDLIITDHHKDIAPEPPNAFAIVNPSRRDEPEGPMRALAGVGVAFALCLEIKKVYEEETGDQFPSIYPLLQLVAVGTVCDLAPLVPMNLKMTRHGLKQIPTSCYPGIRSFLSEEERKMTSLPSERLSFYMGPIINSKGRMDHPEMALKLLIAPNSDEAFERFSHLEISNKERQFVQKEVFVEARELIQNQMTDGEHLISIAYAPEWHEGVIGIVASKLVEEFKVPAIVFTNASEEGIIKASARSVADLSIFDLLKQCDDLFEKFGGHKQAAGLSMKKENLSLFREKMNAMLKNIPAIERRQESMYDLELDFSAITPALLRELELLEPFGQGNAKPIFKSSGVTIQSFKVLKDVHVKWNFQQESTSKEAFGGISFNYVGSFGRHHPNDLYQLQQDGGLTIYYTLGINRWNGNEYIQLMVSEIRPGF